MVMPVMVLAISIAGSNIRYVRSAVLEILQKIMYVQQNQRDRPFLTINKHAPKCFDTNCNSIRMQIPTLFGG